MQNMLILKSKINKDVEWYCLKGDRIYGRTSLTNSDEYTDNGRTITIEIRPFFKG